MKNIDNRIRCEKDVNKSEFFGLHEVDHYEPEAAESPKELISSTMKQRRDMLQEEPRQSVPGPGQERCCIWLRHLKVSWASLRN